MNRNGDRCIFDFEIPPYAIGLGAFTTEGDGCDQCVYAWRSRWWRCEDTLVFECSDFQVAPSIKHGLMRLLVPTTIMEFLACLSFDVYFS